MQPFIKSFYITISYLHTAFEPLFKIVKKLKMAEEEIPVLYEDLANIEAEFDEVDKEVSMCLYAVTRAGMVDDY